MRNGIMLVKLDSDQLVMVINCTIANNSIPPYSRSLWRDISTQAISVSKVRFGGTGTVACRIFLFHYRVDKPIAASRHPRDRASNLSKCRSQIAAELLTGRTLMDGASNANKAAASSQARALYWK